MDWSGPWLFLSRERGVLLPDGGDSRFQKLEPLSLLVEELGDRICQRNFWLRFLLGLDLRFGLTALQRPAEVLCSRLQQLAPWLGGLPLSECPYDMIGNAHISRHLIVAYFLYGVCIVDLTFQHCDCKHRQFGSCTFLCNLLL